MFKKIQKILIMSIFIVSVSLSGQIAQFTPGSLSVLKNEPTLSIAITYNGTIIGNYTESQYVQKKVEEINTSKPGQGDKWKEKWEYDKIQVYLVNFVNSFNKLSVKNGKTLIYEDTPNYQMQVNVDVLEPGFSGYMANKPGYVDLTISIIDVKNAAVIATHKQMGEPISGDTIEKRLGASFAKSAMKLVQPFMNGL